MENHGPESWRALKSKYVDTDTSMLKQLLSSKAEAVNEIKRSQNQQFNEDETKIKELMAKLAAIKETLHTETQILEQKNNELLKEKAILTELEVEKKKLLQEIKQLEGERNSLKAAKPNLRDQQLLEQGRKKLKLYRDLTRIQWDYEASRHGIQGYVSNKRDYIHHFCYEKQEINEQIVDSLWHEIYLSTGKVEIKDEDPQPNVPVNAEIRNEDPQPNTFHVLIISRGCDEK
ncbi:PREDICTED: uncharacterized protein LOC105456349 isoform X2 [Wasmannia auropunctata]|uniref:uncharacterized protein LOC105456349 isoform X2 n=1 Tax=Wasmannia auropunctata TaxID=64793 RepID=UPI0005EFC11E|nr:PREDICTED: uncharacterized protein LOC105456349 isoform X2 [Wasmannia auropunctata]